MNVDGGLPEDVVERCGLIFELGEYGDRDFSLNEEEADAAIAAFTPVDLDIEHQQTVFDGRLGKLVDVWRDGAAIRGRVHLPTWLDEALAGGKMKVSTAWDRDGKMLKGLSLVREPRVSEAALMSAYAAFARPKRNTPTGQRHLQQLHDMTTERGATCAPGSGGNGNGNGGSAGMSQFASTHEARAIQQVHDLTAEHGAQCEQSMDDVRDRDSGGNVSAAPLIYGKDRTKERKRGMNVDFRALFSGLFGAIEEREEAGTASPPVQSAPVLAPARAQNLDASTATVQSGSATSGVSMSGVTAPDPRIAELEKQIAERDAVIAKEAEARIQREASLFAEEMVRASKAVPSEQEKLAAAFAQAMRDDQRHDAVTFKTGDGQESKTSRVQQLRDVYEARPAGLLTQQMLPDGQDGQQTSALYNKQTTERTGPDGRKVDAPLSAERRRQLLEGSSLGRAVIREAAKNGNGHNN